MASYPARAEEAKLMPMTSSPGILPFELGTSKIRQSDHVFLHFIDLDCIRNHIKIIESQVFTLEALVHDLSKNYKFRFLTLQEYITGRLNNILDKYNSISKTRFRRALIDGLGTLIHSITGNLDQNDARRYNAAISVLQKNQNNLAHHVNQAITLNKLFLENFNSTISTIVRNQNKLSLKISELIRYTNVSEQTFIDFVKLDSSYKLLEINVQIIFDTLTNLETAISLSIKHIAYRNLISFSNVEYFITELTKHYMPNQLITSDVKESRLFYNFLDVSSYFSDNKLVFVIKVPIFFKDIFTYYYLFPIPTSNSTILIPNKSYLVMNENAYQYLDIPCDRVENIHYCQSGNTLLQEAKYNSDCVYTLITTQKLTSQCQYHQINIDQEIFEMINNEYYIIFSHNFTKLHIQCVQDEYLQIKGVYLLRLPENCSASTEKLKFINLHNVFYGKPIKLFAFNFNDAKIKDPLQRLKINQVNLKQLHNSVGFLEREQQNVKLEDMDFQPHLYWTTPLYIISILTVLYILYVKWKKLRATRATIENVETEIPEIAQNEAIPRSLFR